MNDALARQLFVKRTAGRFGRWIFGGRSGAFDGISGFAFADRRHQFAKLHLELIDEPRAFFRTGAVLAALHLGNGQFQMRDLTIEIQRPGLCHAGTML